jgi:hypothetical protein
VIACITVPLAALERPENAEAKAPMPASPLIEQAGSPAVLVAATSRAAGAAAAARNAAERNARDTITVFGRPGGPDATGGAAAPAAGATERTVASLVVAFRRKLAVAQVQVKRERKAAALARRKANPRSAICMVFGSRCGEALRVAHCESRFDTSAQNGQYLGLFQMGSYERATYGHGYTAYEQAVAAHRYFVASGSDWSPWQCKPWW